MIRHEKILHFIVICSRGHIAQRGLNLDVSDPSQADLYR